MNIEPLGLHDLDLIKELQPPDWDDIIVPHREYVSSPRCTSLKFTLDGRIMGIGTAICHKDTAWLAHIIVHADFRSRGLGSIITDALLKVIDRERYETVYLIATDLGYPVYLKAGFKEEAEYVLYENKDPLHFDTSPFIIPAEKPFIKEILDLDQQVTGEDRENWLSKYILNSFVFSRTGKIEGVYFPGLANGLIIAGNPEAGIGLMKLRLQAKRYAIFPNENREACGFLEVNNFIRLRIARRMILGKKRAWQPACIYNRVSGQIG